MHIFADFHERKSYFYDMHKILQKVTNMQALIIILRYAQNITNTLTHNHSQNITKSYKHASTLIIFLRYAQALIIFLRYAQNITNTHTFKRLQTRIISLQYAQNITNTHTFTDSHERKI